MHLSPQDPPALLAPRPSTHQKASSASFAALPLASAFLVASRSRAASTFSFTLLGGMVPRGADVLEQQGMSDPRAAAAPTYDPRRLPGRRKIVQE